MRKLNFRESWLLHRDYTLLNRKSEKSVQEEITEAKYNVKDWYPIYSETVGGWQADLMFLNVKIGKIANYKEQCLLCVININFKYAFVKELSIHLKKIKILHGILIIKKYTKYLVIPKVQLK